MKKKNGTCTTTANSKLKKLTLNPFTITTVELNESKSPTIEVKPLFDFFEVSKSSQIIGLENCQYFINQWYNCSLKDCSHKFLLLLGPVGCGKTKLLELYSKENDILLYVVKSSESIKTRKELISDIIHFIEYSTSDGINDYTTFFCNKEQNINKLILIDEYSNSQNDLLGTNDILNLMSLRKANKNIESLTKTSKKELETLFNGTNYTLNYLINIDIPPVLIIGADLKGSNISDLKKTLEVYSIQEINKALLIEFVNKYNNYSKLKLNKTIIQKIVNKCKSDKRLLINILKYISLKSNNNERNTEKDINLYIETFYKDEDINIYEFVNQLFDKVEPVDIETVFKVYSTDGYILSNLIHENYLDYSNSIENIAQAADSMSYGDCLLASLYDSNNHNFIQENHCIYSVYVPSYYSRSNKVNKSSARASVINNRYNILLNNKSTIAKINLNETRLLSIDDIYIFKMFINGGLVKLKEFNNNTSTFLKNILSIFSENKVDKLELIYKHFVDFNFKDSIGKEPGQSLYKTKSFTNKFKNKLIELIN